MICLHTGSGGDYWCTDEAGRQVVFDKLDSQEALKSANYRVLGSPENYRLITELYSRLSQQEVDARLCVGSVRLCRSRNSTVRDVLNCISMPTVHDSLCNQWHVVTSRSFNNYLLLRAYEEEGFSDLVTTVFRHHCLSKHFEFAGVPSHYAIQLISMIVDPRWFLSVKRPMRMQPFEAYFGLDPGYFREAVKDKSDKRPSSKLIRTLFLSNVVKAADRDSFVHDAKDHRQQCKVLLSYIVRNWLDSLGFEGYFVPQKFFFGFGHLCKEYQHRFRDT